MSIQCQRLLFRVSSEPRFGAGHLARVLSLRNFLPQKVSWFVDPATSDFVRRLIPAGDLVTEEFAFSSISEFSKRSTSPDVNGVLLDNPHVDTADLAGLKPPVFLFSDYEIISELSNVTLINCQPRASSKFDQFVGTNLLPIDTKGRRQKNLDYSSFGSTPYINCLISFGATDNQNCSKMALSAILQDDFFCQKVRPICLLGPYFKHKNSLDKILDRLNAPKIVTDCQTLFDLPEDCDCTISIGAPGLSHAERLYMGIATVLVPQNKKHDVICSNWQSLGCGIVARADCPDIAKKLHILIENNYELARKISARGQKIIDGKGAPRLAKRIIESLRERQ